MRVTNALITRDTIARLQQSQRALLDAQERVTSGKRITRMSDDPAAASAAMQTSGALRGVEQYRRNVASVGSRLDAEEGALDQVTQLLTRGKEVAAGQLGLPATPGSRKAAAAEVKGLLDQAISIANQRFGEEFLFGGASSATVMPFDATQTAVDPPFVRLAPLPDPVPVPPPPPTTVLPQGRRAVEIGAGQTMPGQHDGDTVFVQSDVLKSLHDLYTALDTDDTAGIGTAVATIDGAFANVQALVGDVGARQNQVQALGAHLDALQLNLAEQKSGLTEVEMEQAITEMLTRQTAYQAAMLASSKVMGMSLTDYIR